MSQKEVKERILFRSQILKWLEDCFRSHLNDSDPAMRNGFGYDFVEVTNEQLKDLALIA